MIGVARRRFERASDSLAGSVFPIARGLVCILKARTRVGYWTSKQITLLLGLNRSDRAKGQLSEATASLQLRILQKSVDFSFPLQISLILKQRKLTSVRARR